MEMLVRCKNAIHTKRYYTCSCIRVRYTLCTLHAARGTCVAKTQGTRARAHGRAKFNVQSSLALLNPNLLNPNPPCQTYQRNHMNQTREPNQLSATKAPWIVDVVKSMV